MNIKKMSAKLFAAAFAVVAACGFTACTENPGEGGGTIDTNLEVMFGADLYEVLPGQQISIPFTITGTAGQELAIEAKSNNAACTVEVVRDEFVGDNVVFTAPKITEEALDVIVLLNVKDAKNNRDAKARATVKVAKSEELTIAYQSVVKSIAVKAGESISLPVVVSGIGAATVNEPTVTVSTGWSASFAWTNKDKGFGEVTLTAPATLGASVNVKVAISDNFNRSAELNSDLSIVAITTVKDAANCHIVAPGETLTINAVKGNSAEKLTFNNATLVWQDALNMVKSVSANANEGVIVVELNAGIEGNAVVAAKQDDTIVWSWHVWVSNYDANAEENVMVYDWVKKNADGEVTEEGTTYWMDRNLGARNATLFDAGALGLFYQWGRKDPFVGADGVESSVYVKKYDINGNQVHEVSKLRPVYPEDDYVSTNLEVSIQNPTIFYYAPSSAWPVVDWLTDRSALQNNDLWGGVSGHKTIYDPCPYGWKVPAAGAPWSFRKLYKKQGKLNDDAPYDETQPWYIYWDLDKCIGFRYKAPGTEKEWWFPFTGKKEPNDGTLTGVGGGANYHTATTSNTTALMEIMAWGNPTSETGLNRTYGSSVRCVKDADVE